MPSGRVPERWRTQVTYWTDSALNLNCDEELIIPCNSIYYQKSNILRIKEYISEMTNYCPDSVYKFLDVFGKFEKGFRYIVFQKLKTPPNIAYVRKKIEVDKAIAILIQSKHTRVGQIREMLKDGTLPGDIRTALGKTISKSENAFISQFENNFSK